MRTLLLVTWIAAGVAGVPQSPAPADAALTEVRQAVEAARKDVAWYNAEHRSGEHPAIKWDATLWAYRDRYPNSRAATVATAEAVRLLAGAELWDRAQARIDSVGADDPAWERLATVVYEEGIARKTLPSTIEKLSSVARMTTAASNKATALIVTGRAYRRMGDKDAAIRALSDAKAAAPGAPSAEEADGLIYEIRHLSVGLLPPPIDTTARDGRAINLASLHGKVVVLVFWGTT